MQWYSKHKRDLPWRRTHDPYVIWISEVLLQQTQVETVRPYFDRFITAFPDVFALAKAPLDRVFKAWEGCGYYARAKNLHRAAQIIAENGGQLPYSAVELQKLPGIGPYTAAAIASIAFNEPYPVLDGNVERVLARLLCERGYRKAPLTQKRFQKAAQLIIDSAFRLHLKPGDVNQALMEIGATVCKPRQALCANCPLKEECCARLKLSDVTVLPKQAPHKVIPHYNIGAAIIRKKGKILITKRPLEGLLGGLWEFPGGKANAGELLEDCVRREIQEELDIEVEIGDLFIKVKHAYTHFKITLFAYNCTHKSGRIKKIGVADFRWVTPSELVQYAFPKADRVILEKMRTIAD